MRVCMHACVLHAMAVRLTSILLADHDVRSEPVELRAIRQPVKAGSARGAAAWVWRRQYPVRPATLRREDEDESFEHACLGGAATRNEIRESAVSVRE